MLNGDHHLPNCAKTLGLTFSCQAAAARASSAASRAQRSTIMALVTSRHHSGTLAKRGAQHERAGHKAAGGGLAAAGRGRGASAGRACAGGAPRSRMRGAAECGPRT